MTIDNLIHPDDHPELAIGNKQKERDWETILLVGLSLFGLGILAVFGMLEPPVIEQSTSSIIANTNIISP